MIGFDKEYLQEVISDSNITAAWAVDREFVYIMGSCVGPLGGFGGSFGVLLGGFGGPLGGCGRPLGPVAPPTTSPCSFYTNKKLFFSFFRSLSTKSGLREHETAEAGEAGEAGEAEVVSKTVARSPPSTHAGGQDDGSYTNSLKPVRP